MALEALPTLARLLLMAVTPEVHTQAVHLEADKVVLPETLALEAAGVVVLMGLLLICS